MSATIATDWRTWQAVHDMRCYGVHKVDANTENVQMVASPPTEPDQNEPGE